MQPHVIGENDTVLLNKTPPSRNCGGAGGGHGHRPTDGIEWGPQGVDPDREHPTAPEARPRVCDSAPSPRYVANNGHLFPILDSPVPDFP